MPTIPFQATRGHQGFLKAKHGLKIQNGNLELNPGNGLQISND